VDLRRGNIPSISITVFIYSLYLEWNSNQFGGNKYIVISTASGYGGKNTSLETLYWICTALSLAFVVILKVQRILNNMKIKGKDMP